MNLRMKAVALVASTTFVLALAPGLALADPVPTTDEARAAMMGFGTELAEFENELATAGDSLEKTKAEITQTEEQLEQTRAEYESVRSQLQARMRADYKNGASSLIDIVLGSSDFEDFVSRIYYISRLNNQDVTLLDAAKSLRDELIAHMSELEERKVNCEEILANVDAKIAELTAKLSEAQTYFNALPGEVQTELSNEVVAQIEQGEIERNDQGVVTDGLVSAVTNVQVINYQQEQATGGDPVATSDATNTVIEAVATSPTSADAYTTDLGGAVERAYSAIGVQYTWGGADMDTGFDCSGLVNYAYGEDRGRTTYEMIDSLQDSGDWKTDISELEYGDLIFPSEGHVGIYLGDGQMIHSPRPGEAVEVTDVYGFVGGGTF